MTDLFNNPSIVAALFIALAIWPALLAACERRAPRAADGDAKQTKLKDDLYKKDGYKLSYELDTPGETWIKK